jgi:PAS domain S-box-containing protein
MNETASQGRILIVEGDPATADLESRVLRQAGFTPQVANALGEARRLLETGGFAALLLDYRLPDGDAWDLVAGAREMIPPVPVILVTALGGEALAAEAVLRGVSEYIRKTDGFQHHLGPAVERATRLTEVRESAHRNEALFRSIAEHASDAIVLLDGDDAILWASAAAEQVFADESRGLIGRRLDELLHPEDRAAWHKGDQWTETARTWFRCRDRQGRYLTFEPTFHTIGEGQVVRTLGVLRDVTDRLHLDEQLRHNQRLEAIGQLTGGIAHDFNNVLAVIIASLDMLRTDVEEGSSPWELAGDALEAALRGADLTARLLGFARRQPLRPESCNVNAAVEATLRLLSRTLGEGIRIETVLAADLSPVMADRLQLETALTNLATNARDAMPNGGQIVISTCNVFLDADYAQAHPGVLPNDYVQIEVRDTGVGMPPETLDRIFEPFFTTKAAGQGTGLGLSMVFGFVKQSGGHISAWSEVGIGTAIRLCLPRLTGSARQEPPPPPGAVAGRNRTILIAEDNVKLRQLTARQLTGAGYQVLEAGDGASAMAILDSGTPVDLLFSDIVMPGELNGYDLAQIGTARRPGLRVVLTSGYPDMRADWVRIASPEYRLLRKPYRRSVLLEAIAQALEAAPAAQGARGAKL